MPGHKRNDKFGIVGSEIDVTEIDGMDNLHCPTGAILDIENRLSYIYNSKKTFLLVNGSTVGILASIFSLCNVGDKIIIARNCHKSVYNACMMLLLNVVYIEPDYDNTDGYYKRIDQNAVNDAISNHPDAKAVVITSPTYEGNISNVKSSIPLIVDCAHGAHLGLSYFPSYPKGDIVVSSLHKTLPALTQTAVLNVYNEELVPRVKQFLDMLQTSSPSYVLMNSVDICCDFILDSKRDFLLDNKSEFNCYYSMLADFRCVKLDNLRLKFTDDPSKIVVSTSCTNITGIELANMLRNDYKIEVEMASLSYVVLMTSVGDTIGAFDALKNALCKIDDNLSYDSSNVIKRPPVPSGVNTISISNDSSLVHLDLCVGKRSNEFVYAYPPDIPVLAPNELITQEVVDYIKKAIDNGVNIVSDSGLLPNKMLTKCN